MTLTLEKLKYLMKPIFIFTEESDNATKGLSLLCGSPVPIEIGYRLLDAYISVIKEQIGDSSNWIDYFVYDCELGKTPMKVYHLNGKKVSFKLKSIEDLYRVLTEGGENEKV